MVEKSPLLEVHLLPWQHYIFFLAVHVLITILLLHQDESVKPEKTKVLTYGYVIFCMILSRSAFLILDIADMNQLAALTK